MYSDWMSFLQTFDFYTCFAYYIVDVLPRYFLARFQHWYSNKSEFVPMDYIYHKRYGARNTESTLIHGIVALWYDQICATDHLNGMTHWSAGLT
jgi:hypothetical protein